MVCCAASVHRQEYTGRWREGPLSFAPTYKLDVGSLDTYDSGPKQRIPAWCDRVLWKSATAGGGQGPSADGGVPAKEEGVVRLVEYNAVPSFCCSDHKPVFASFALDLEPIDRPSPRTVGRNAGGEANGGTAVTASARKEGGGEEPTAGQGMQESSRACVIS